ncbi:MAG TPA: AMIN domain-containing protein, partial [Burkholderiales bacterium]|nr:AMIN domain-containing protein [Burkholderiales bacterium]
MSGCRALRAGLLPLFLLAFALPVLAGPNITSARFWPAPEYSRLTLESDAPIRHSVAAVKNPDRLVIDLEEVEAGVAIKELPAKVGDADPYVKAVRLGRPGPGVLRLVLDLRTEVIPQIFALKPVGEYGHRLVVDVYPAAPADPLMALFLQQEGRMGDSAAAATPRQASPPAQAPETAP